MWFEDGLFKRGRVDGKLINRTFGHSVEMRVL